MSQKRFCDVIIMYNDVVLHIIIIKHGYIAFKGYKKCRSLKVIFV